LRVQAQIRRAMLASYARVKLREDGAWAYQPWGVNPLTMRKVTMAALGEDSGPSRARMYCPPVDLIRATVENAPGAGSRRLAGIGLGGSSVNDPGVSAGVEVLGLGGRGGTGRRSVEPNWWLRVVNVGL
jgi:hypothetical protein